MVSIVRKEDLLKLDIQKIRPNGRYVDMNIPLMFSLSTSDISFLRKYYNNPHIAQDVIIENSTKNYKMTREQKYHRYKLKSSIKKKAMIPVILFGTLVFISTSFLSQKLQVVATNKDYESSGIIYEDPTAQDIRDELDRYQSDQYDLQDYHSSLVSEGYIDEMSERIDYIMYLCDVYQVDFHMVYDHLNNITNHFTSDDYVHNHHIPGVTCKGEEIYASNEEELLLYYVRCCKQAPGNIQLSERGLYVDRDYDSRYNYYQSIYRYSTLLGVDPCLVYGIIMSESGLNSELFNESNNPAGLRDPENPEGFWSFDTSEEGIIETCLEIRKYNRNGLCTIEDISKTYCPIGDRQDVNGLNENWVSNVTYNYEYAKEHFEEVFQIENIERKIL